MERGERGNCEYGSKEGAKAHQREGHDVESWPLDQEHRNVAATCCQAVVRRRQAATSPATRATRRRRKHTRATAVSPCSKDVLGGGCGEENISIMTNADNGGEKTALGSVARARSSVVKGNGRLRLPPVRRCACVLAPAEALRPQARPGRPGGGPRWLDLWPVAAAGTRLRRHITTSPSLTSP